MDFLKKFDSVLPNQMKLSLYQRLKYECDKLESLEDDMKIGDNIIEIKNFLNSFSVESEHQEFKIPKIIHYCWFGKGNIPTLTQKCMESWKKYCPDYEIIEWNESNFDITSNLFVKQAYDSKKYAFVSDYVRAYVLFNFGGIYLDTDVELLKPLDEFLNHDGFTCFENPSFIQTALIGAKKNFHLINELLDYYKGRSFIINGSFDLTTNVNILSQICDAYGFVRDGQYQSVDGFIVYPQEYFCPLCFNSSEKTFTNNTHAIHYFNGSWR